jgi:hypothetical protein
MVPHIIVIGAPMVIIEFIASHRSLSELIIDASLGLHFITIPSGVISQLMRQLMGGGIIIGIMPIIPMGPIIGFAPNIDIIGFIIIGVIGIIMLPIPMPGALDITGIPIGIDIGIPIMLIAFISCCS